MEMRGGDEAPSRLVELLVPLMERTCPAGTGGYGGGFTVILTSDVAARLGGR